MRQLTSRQKEYIDKLIEVYKNKNVELRTIADIEDNHYETLKNFNDTEILWQEVNRYIGDKRFAELSVNS